MSDLSPDTVEIIFRREAGRLISVLTRLLGPPNLQLAEDVIQEAFVAAMQDWSARGVPENPSAWTKYFLLGLARAGLEYGPSLIRPAGRFQIEKG